jgi:hypothetical protein
MAIFLPVSVQALPRLLELELELELDETRRAVRIYFSKFLSFFLSFFLSYSRAVRSYYYPTANSSFR